MLSSIACAVPASGRLRGRVWEPAGDLGMNAPVILDGKELILDGTKIAWHVDRLAQWERGERFAPVTVDIALTRACNYGCHFCYAMLQENANHVISRDIIY